MAMWCGFGENMKPKTKLFLSLLWRDVSDFSSGVTEVIAVVTFPLTISLCVVLEITHLLCLWSNDKGVPIALLFSSHAIIAIAAIYGLYKWLKLRWDHLPDKTP